MKTFILSKLKAAKQSIQSTFSSERIQMVDISKLKFDKDFKELFAQEPDKVERIAVDMMERGYDKSQPIIVTKDFAILDGNSRYLACQKAGITTIPIILKDFADKDEALRYELHLQLDRRNLSDAVIFSMFQKLEEKKAKAKAQGKDTEEFTDKKLGEQLQRSERQVQKLRELARKAGPQTIEKIISGQTSINRAYSEVKQSEEENKPKRPKTVDVVEFRRGVAFAVKEFEKGKSPNEILSMIQEA
ncbi:MAG: ParB N-terminal domain-containing protein [Treponema sp.]|nr:ParB N-terminal domain-containing protein [Treponema sp.]